MTCLAECLKALIDRGELSDTAAGIAAKVAADGGTQKLSPKQLFVYNDEVSRFVDQACASSDCPNKASYESLRDAIVTVEDIEDVSGYCEHCSYIAGANAKDD